MFYNCTSYQKGLNLYVKNVTNFYGMFYKTTKDPSNYGVIDNAAKSAAGEISWKNDALKA